MKPVVHKPKNTAKRKLKVEITIECTDKTCADCAYWFEERCLLFMKKTKLCKDKKYLRSFLDTDGTTQYYEDMARCKECLEAEV